jgi:hypothetical protein
MYFMIPRIAKLAVLFSVLNIITWVIDWFRFNLGYFGPSFFALIPQLALTVWLYVISRRYDVFQYRILTPFIALLLWAVTLLVSSFELIFSDLEIPWHWSSTLLDTMGFPILEMQYGGVAPLLGLFHSNQKNLDIAADWYFDGGIVFWWLAFNVLLLLVITFGARIAFQDRHDGTFFGNLKR